LKAREKAFAVLDKSGKFEINNLKIEEVEVEH
jgi:hypothetical protein